MSNDESTKRAFSRDYSLNDRRKRYYSNQQISIGALIGFIAVTVFMYLLLLGPEHTFFSLSNLLNDIDHFSSKAQLIVLSLIPVYLSFLIFGGGALGGMIGHYLQKFWHHFIHKN